MSTNMVVAKTILEQLGGKRFIAMTGARGFVGSETTLTFDIPRSNNVRVVRVTLDPDDTYTVQFFKTRFTQIEIKRFESVYCDQLQELFTSVTGLCTHL